MAQNEDLTEQITKVLKRLDTLESKYRVIQHKLCLKFELGKVRTNLKQLVSSYTALYQRGGTE